MDKSVDMVLAMVAGGIAGLCLGIALYSQLPIPTCPGQPYSTIITRDRVTCNYSQAPTGFATKSRQFSRKTGREFIDSGATAGDNTHGYSTTQGEP